jgi:hypothetical protein
MRFVFPSDYFNFVINGQPFAPLVDEEIPAIMLDYAKRINSKSFRSMWSIGMMVVSELLKLEMAKYPVWSVKWQKNLLKYGFNK